MHQRGHIMAQLETSWWSGAKKTTLLAAAIVALLLSGCGILRTDITFLQGERWKASVRMTIPAQMVSMYGGEAGIDSLLQQQAQSEWQQLQQVMKKERGKDGSVTYVFSSEGSGLYDLNEKVFQGQASISRNPDGTIAFSYSPGWGAEMYGLSITGGKIISSNADQVKGNTAIWNDLIRSGSAEVVLTESTGSNINLGLLGGGALLIMAAAALFLFARSRRQTAAAVKTSDSLAIGFCMRCGAKAMPGARFCPSCGAEITLQKTP
jgi:ribosomal protein L40E